MSETELQKGPLLIPAAIAALMLFGALASWPYGYYQFLRLVVCGVGAYVTFMAYNWQISWATYLFGLIAVLFNPLVPIHLSREIWQPIDLVCALLFAFVAFALKEPVEKTGKKEDGRPRPQKPPWARVKATNCLLLLAIALVPLAVVAALSKLTGEPAKTVQAATGFEAWKAENQARRAGKTHTQPQPLDISIDEIELYDCMLDSMGSMSGFIKNGSKAILQEVDSQIVVRNLKKDVIYQGDFVIRCAIPPGEARGFNHPGAVPARNLRLGFDRSFQWTWEAYWVSACGARVETQPDIFDQIPSKPEE